MITTTMRPMHSQIISSRVRKSSRPQISRIGFSPLRGGEGVRRTLYTFLSAVSMLLWSVTVLTWVRSLDTRDDVFWVSSRMGLGVSSGLGYVYFWQASSRPPIPREFGWEFHHEVRRPPTTALAVRQSMRHISLGGVALQWGRGAETDWIYYHRDLFIPAWLLLAFFSVLPTRWVWIHWRHRESEHLCKACRYDLTGNTSGICPECGSAIHAPSNPPESKAPAPRS